MPTPSSYLAFCIVAISLILTPGPNLAYLLSRSVSQGAGAGLVSLGGVATGFLIYMMLAVVGITTAFTAIPHAMTLLQFAGVSYFLFMARKTVAIRTGVAIDKTRGPQETKLTLFRSGLLISIFNPKVTLLYVSLLPQFIDASRGHVFLQALILGITHIVLSVLINGVLTVGAARTLGVFITRAASTTVVRLASSIVFVALALHLAFSGGSGSQIR